MLSTYVDYYNRTRTHLALTKDAHEHRTVCSGPARAGWSRSRASVDSITNTYDGRREQIGRISRRHRGAREIVAVDLDGHREVVVRTGFDFPFCIDWLPDGRLLIVSGRESRLVRRELMWSFFLLSLLLLIAARVLS